MHTTTEEAQVFHEKEIKLIIKNYPPGEIRDELVMLLTAYTLSKPIGSDEMCFRIKIEAINRRCLM